MPDYDATLFTPPAPLAKVILRNQQTGAIVKDVPMLIDSGSDATLLPQAFVDRISVDANQNESYELMGFDGSISTARAVQLDLIFLDRAFKGRFLLLNQEWGLIGRDILNHVSLLFDGPNLSWRGQP
jgi:hypothetical protein